MKAQPLNSNYSVYKTIKCKYFEKEGTCKYGSNCSFAHGDSECRNPTDPVPPNIAFQNIQSLVDPSFLNQCDDNFLKAYGVLVLANIDDSMIKEKIIEAYDYIHNGDQENINRVISDLIILGGIRLTLRQ